MQGDYDDEIESFQVIDCRFDYEHNGGHIPGAVNLSTNDMIEEYLLGSDKPVPSRSGDAVGRKRILVFHCEFSVKRAPTFAKHLRSKDRSMNGHVYPNIHYPEVYILEGGYSGYYQTHTVRSLLFFVWVNYSLKVCWCLGAVHSLCLCPYGRSRASTRPGFRAQ